MAWIRTERVTWGERALWAAFVAASVVPTALRPASGTIARDYVAAINRGDVEEEARRVLEWRAALHERWRVVSWEYDSRDREVHALVEISNDAWRLVAPPPALDVVLVMREGGMLVEGIRTCTQGLRRPLQPFLHWASRERPLALGRVWLNGRPVPGAESATELLDLLRAWRAADGTVAGAVGPEHS